MLLMLGQIDITRIAIIAAIIIFGFIALITLIAFAAFGAMWVQAFAAGCAGSHVQLDWHVLPSSPCAGHR